MSADPPPYGIDHDWPEWQKPPEYRGYQIKVCRRCGMESDAPDAGGFCR